MTESGNGRVRADARRNRAAIVTAARAAVAEQGGEVPLEQIARRANVNARTLFRHFPTRDDLVAAVLEDYLAERVAPVLRRAAADPDPRRALLTVLTETTAAVVEQPGVLGLVNGGAPAAAVLARQLPPLADILARAQRAGAVRADLTPEDIPCLVTMVAASADHTGRGWARYLALLLDSLPPAAAGAPLPPAGA
ncbi:TetR/AcrR family transcriptional regulator [Streptomyces sp. DSM 44915]|uniref:TetR/AcrR family transcriptional regulator n=1 Tax=Streptomyces chisholmiae TaxID=3075540 RepID=A0ABU2JXF1_9ACTN|nr:TetR/AcrR family transcriptional regulator [Streptomyces sp. DSM 44915]MDT0269645.1 TetR/AcrR family transcriptional regulator [Streptomyces sp. DSM 44915]